MIIQYTTGCICDSLTIDNEETVDMDINNIKPVIHKLIDSEVDIITIQEVLINLVQSQGNYKSDKKPCECCGDYVEHYTLTIK